ncbi:MAG: SAM-dependent methyltransferase [Firmicutes bacterium]|nr:SAM-dependent methyltransferase [Bacillota bacterium]
MRIKLSNRLQAVAKYVTPGARVADIGTDHGYLPVYLVVNDLSPRVIATDRGKGPLAAAGQLVSLLSLDTQIDLRLGDGLAVLQPAEVDVVCIAGMGGMAIRDILAEGMPVARSLKRLVLQPQRNVPAVRNFLVENGWRIVAEDLAEDDGFYYEIIVAEPGEMALSEEEAEFGPLLLAEGHPLLEDFLLLRQADLTRLLESMAANNSEESLRRKEQLQGEIARVAEVIELQRQRVGK